MPPSLFDSLDYAILRLLNRDSRAPASEIARQVGANERTIRKRIDRLVDLGAVRMAAIVQPETFGYITAVDIFLEVDPDQEENVIRLLSAMQEISYIAFGQGTREVSIEARFKSNDAMREFIRRSLPAIPGLHITRYALVPRILRNIDEWMPSQEDFAGTNKPDEDTSTS